MNTRYARGFLIGSVMLVLTVAAALRFWSLPQPPAGPYYDEAANGILADGIANRGERPLFITSYTGKEVLFFYGAALLIKLVGPGLLALRLTSAILGTLTVVAALWCANELFPCLSGRQSLSPIALLTAGLLASSFWHLALSRIGLRAVAQPLLQALTLACLWRGLRNGRLTMLLAAGFFCGLTGYTYLAARLFPVPLALALATLLMADRARWRQRLAQMGLFIGTAVLTFAPLGLYFLRNPESFGVRIAQVAVQKPTLTLSAALIKALGIFFVTGDPLPRINLPGQPIFGPLLAAAFLLGLALTVHQLFSCFDPLDRARSVLLLAWIPTMILPTALAVADIIPHNLRAAGLLPLVYLFPAMSIAWLLERAARRRAWPAGAPIFTVLLVLLAATAPPTAHGYFVELAGRSDHYEISDGDLADMAEWLNAADLAGSSVYLASIHYRHPTLAFLAQDYERFKWLTGGRTLVISPQDSSLLLVPRSVDFSWAKDFLPQSSILETPDGPDGDPAFQAFLLHPDTPLDLAGDIEVDFSHIIQLEGYAWLNRAGTDGTVEVLLQWQVLNPPPSGDFHVFAHLLDSWGFSWAEELPFQYPSDQWTPGERFLDRIQLALPPGTPPGEYTLHVGLYSPENNQNLTVVGANERFAGIVATLPLTIHPARHPQPLTDIRRPLHLELAPGLTLLGVNLDTTSAPTLGPIYLSLFWRAETALEDLTIRLFIGDRVLYQGKPVHGSYPTSSWGANEGVVDRYHLQVPLDTPAGEWSLSLQVIRPDGSIQRASLGSITVTAPERDFTVPNMQNPADALLGEAVELLGYDLTKLDDQTAEFTLYWRPAAEIEIDYTVFAHLWAADGSLVGQVDNAPQNGNYPTSWWAAGEVIKDTYHIPIAHGARLPLSLEVGMYLPLTGDYLGATTIKLE